MSARPRPPLRVAGFAARALSLLEHGILDDADVSIVDAAAERFGERDPEVLLGLAFALRAPRVGHVGVALAEVRDRVDDERPLRHIATREAPPAESPAWPADPAAWQRAVLASPMVGEPAQRERPFVRQPVERERVLLMTRRMWREQERVAAAARAMAAGEPHPHLDDRRIAAGIARFWAGEGDSQGARAMVAAARHRLTVVTGGPGTGKTYAIKRLIALLVTSHADPRSPLRIELAAPTGKAAVRMAEAIAEGLDELRLAPDHREVLAGLRPRTLHKLLGMRPDGSSRHDRERPLPADLVVVDEASMVDLALMRRLFEAIPAGARLILLGDRDQLASVEAGTVLADLVAPVLDEGRAEPRDLAAAIVPFTENFRFKSAPKIARIAQALQASGHAQVDQVVRWMTGERLAEDPLSERVVHLGGPREGRPGRDQLDALAAPYLDAKVGFIGLLASAIEEHGARGKPLRDRDLHVELLAALDRYRVLAVHRRGPLGVGGLERAIAERARRTLEQAIEERARASQGQMPPGRTALPHDGDHWLGRPLLVTENAYDVGLMNGDLGLVLWTGERLAAVFPGERGGSEPTREIALARLPEHMGAFAMTVHKSQGSQFERVALVLAGRDSPIQTRELVYTAITRSSARLDWLGDPDELARALRRRVARNSGLREVLWDG